MAKECLVVETKGDERLGISFDGYVNIYSVEGETMFQLIVSEWDEMVEYVKQERKKRDAK